MIKKADVILAIFLLAAGLGLLFAIPHEGNVGNEIVVRHGTEVFGVYSLDKDQEIVIEDEQGRNVIQIKDGKAFMKEANCPDQYCVKHEPINKANQSIICLPNKLVVSVESDEQAEVDAVL